MRRTKQDNEGAEDKEFLGLWIPAPLSQLLDQGVKKVDSDRSKFVRAAIREKLQREPALK